MLPILGLAWLEKGLVSHLLDKDKGVQVTSLQYSPHHHVSPAETEVWSGNTNSCDYGGASLDSTWAASPVVSRHSELINICCFYLLLTFLVGSHPALPPASTARASHACWTIIWSTLARYPGYGSAGPVEWRRRRSSNTELWATQCSSSLSFAHYRRSSAHTSWRRRAGEWQWDRLYEFVHWQCHNSPFVCWWTVLECSGAKECISRLIGGQSCPANNDSGQYRGVVFIRQRSCK